VWKNGKINKQREIDRVWKQCPKCLWEYAHYEREDKFDGLLVRRIETYTCTSCRYTWREYES